jgi:hypothetical protein
VIASDAHGGRRSQTLLDGHDLAVAAGVTPWRAGLLTSKGPQRLLRHGLRPARALAPA